MVSFVRLVTRLNNKLLAVRIYVRYPRTLHNIVVCFCIIIHKYSRAENEIPRDEINRLCVCIRYTPYVRYLFSVLPNSCAVKRRHILQYTSKSIWIIFFSKNKYSHWEYFYWCIFFFIIIIHLKILFPRQLQLAGTSPPQMMSAEAWQLMSKKPAQTNDEIHAAPTGTDHQTEIKEKLFEFNYGTSYA